MNGSKVAACYQTPNRHNNRNLNHPQYQQTEGHVLSNIQQTQQQKPESPTVSANRGHLLSNIQQAQQPKPESPTVSTNGGSRVIKHPTDTTETWITHSISKRRVTCYQTSNRHNNRNLNHPQYQQTEVTCYQTSNRHNNRNLNHPQYQQTEVTCYQTSNRHNNRNLNHPQYQQTGHLLSNIQQTQQQKPESPTVSANRGHLLSNIQQTQQQRPEYQQTEGHLLSNTTTVKTTETAHQPSTRMQETREVKPPPWSHPLEIIIIMDIFIAHSL